MYNNHINNVFSLFKYIFGKQKLLFLIKLNQSIIYSMVRIFYSLKKSSPPQSLKKKNLLHFLPKVFLFSKVLIYLSWLLCTALGRNSVSVFGMHIQSSQQFLFEQIFLSPLISNAPCARCFLWPLEPIDFPFFLSPVLQGLKTWKLNFPNFFASKFWETV